MTENKSAAPVQRSVLGEIKHSQKSMLEQNANHVQLLMAACIMCSCKCSVCKRAHQYTTNTLVKSALLTLLGKLVH